MGSDSRERGMRCRHPRGTRRWLLSAITGAAATCGEKYDRLGCLAETSSPLARLGPDAHIARMRVIASDGKRRHGIEKQAQFGSTQVSTNFPKSGWLIRMIADTL